jgi:hypothetical protein
MRKNEIDVDSLILENYKVNDSVFDGLNTKSTLFLRPIIDVIYNFKYFSNLFIDDEKYIHNYESCLFMLLSTKEINKEYKEYDEYLRNTNCYVNSYFIGKSDNGEFFIMYILKINESHIEDFNKFKKGSYSKMSSLLKTKHGRFIRNDIGIIVESTIYRIFSKSHILKRIIEHKIGQSIPENMEYWSIPNEREIYRKTIT